VEGGGFSTVVRSGFGGGRRGKRLSSTTPGMVARDAAVALGFKPGLSVLGLGGAFAKIDEGFGGAAASNEDVFAGDVAPVTGLRGVNCGLVDPIGRVASGTMAPDAGAATGGVGLAPVVFEIDGPRLTPPAFADVLGRGMARGGRSEGRPIVTIIPHSFEERQHVCWGWNGNFFRSVARALRTSRPLTPRLFSAQLEQKARASRSGVTMSHLVACWLGQRVRRAAHFAKRLCRDTSCTSCRYRRDTDRCARRVIRHAAPGAPQALRRPRKPNADFVS
jgi:hypothetical protein